MSLQAKMEAESIQDTDLFNSWIARMRKSEL